MRVLVLGADGYLGWPMAMRFAGAGHDVIATDSYVKRTWETEVEAGPLVPVPRFEQRAATWAALGKPVMRTVVGDLADADFVHDLLSTVQPDAVVHFGEQCSAPYSMISQQAGVSTQVNNIVGNLNVVYALREHAPEAHLVKLGTMGEYGTPNIDIEEGFLDIEHKGRRDRLPFPKQAGSVYHLSKVHDSHNIEFACRVWGLRATDLNQGIVYGLRTPEMGDRPELGTSFHYDEVFGTVLNRFCIQALVGHPLTVYGQGGQTRGILNIVDTLACVQLSVANPAEPGEYRVFNQLTEQFSVAELADKVCAAAATLGLRSTVERLANPRIEKEQHYFRAVHTRLLDLGLRPHLLTHEFLVKLLTELRPYRERIDPSVLLRGVSWRQALATS